MRSIKEFFQLEWVQGFIVGALLVISMALAEGWGEDVGREVEEALDFRFSILDFGLEEFHGGRSMKSHAAQGYKCSTWMAREKGLAE